MALGFRRGISNTLSLVIVIAVVAISGVGLALNSGVLSSFVLQKQYYLNVLSPEGSGSSDPSVGSSLFEADELIRISAVPSEEWTFIHWVLDGDQVLDSSTIYVTMSSNHTVKAFFAELPKSLRVYELNVLGSQGNGSLNYAPNNYRFNQSTSVVVVATPDAGWIFDHWELNGVDIDGANPLTVSIDESQSLKAIFIQASHYTLTILSSEGGGVSFPEAGVYSYNQTVDLSVSVLPDDGWHFDHWVLDGVRVDELSSVYMNDDHVLQAFFAEDPRFEPKYYLNFNTIGEGSVDRSPLKDYYSFGESVQFSATAVEGWEFLGWEGDLTGNLSTVTYIIQGNTSVTAVFIETQIPQSLPPIPPPTPVTFFTLVIGSSMGSGVTSLTEGSHNYAVGSQVVVTAVPSSGWRLDHWVLDGEDAGSLNSMNIFIDTDHELYAVFQQISLNTLNINVYSDSSCSSILTSVSFGSVNPGEILTRIIFIRNDGSVNAQLNCIFAQWDPSEVEKYFSCTCDAEGKVILPGEVLPATITLKIDSDLIGISDYSFVLIINGVE